MDSGLNSSVVLLIIIGPMAHHKLVCSSGDSAVFDDPEAIYWSIFDLNQMKGQLQALQHVESKLP